MLTIEVEGVDEALAALDVVRMPDEILEVALAAVDVELAALLDQVISEIDAARAVGATKLYRQSIAIVPAERTETGISGGVYAGKRPEDQLIQALIMEEGSAPHSRKKHPYFWIRTLEDWVARKIGSAMVGTGSFQEKEELSLKKTSGRKQKDGSRRKTPKQKTADQIRNALAVAIGRKIEEEGIEPRRPFAKAFDALAEQAAERIMAKIDEAIDIAVGRAA